MEFLLKSSYPCIIKTNLEQCELDENDLLEIVDENLLFVYPEDNVGLPFLINLNNLQECEFYSVLHHDGQTIIFLESPQKFCVMNKEILNFSGKKCEVGVSKDKIYFETENKKVECVCPLNNGRFKVFKLGAYACVQFDEELFAYSITNDQIAHFCGEIETEGNIVKLERHFHDSMERKRFVEFEFGNEVEVKNEKFVCNTHNSNFENPDLTPYRFLETVKAKDFDCAFSFLSENLKNQINSIQIKEFFGNFIEFLPLSTTEFITIEPNNKKYVKFNLKDNKVEDIFIDNL